MNNYRLEELPKLVKLARERSLKGMYSEAYELYRASLKLIEERTKTCLNSSIKEQWMKTYQNIRSEVVELNDIQELCNTFKMEKREDQNKKNEAVILRDYLNNNEFINNNDNRNIKHSKSINYIEPKDESENLDKKMVDRFGSKPFEHHNNRNHSDDKADFNYLQNLNIKPVQQQKKASVPQANPVKRQSDVDKKRNYEKPWITNDKEAPKKGKGKDEPVKNSNRR